MSESVEPDPKQPSDPIADPQCACGHSAFWHTGSDERGYCALRDCPCPKFTFHEQFEGVPGLDDEIKI